MNTPEQENYRFGNFELRAAEPAILRAGKPLDLQLKTLQTLVALVRRNGELVTRDELIEEIWPESFVDENNLSQHIRALRRLIAGEADPCFRIETVPRRGYRFVSQVNGLSSPDSAPFGDQGFGRSEGLIGREKELRELYTLLLRSDVRLLTLTGVGGTGKTTLAKALCPSLERHFPDGICFVELGTVTNPDLAMSQIAQALHIKETGNTSVLDVLKNFLREQHLLLVLDNFEQLLPAATALAALIQGARYIKIVVTSRARLRLSVDHEFIVPPLSLPEDFNETRVDAYSKYEAISLFNERARASRPGFVLTEENIRDVVRICVRLDGLPLAIELAAARVKMIPPDAILQKLENRLALLTGGASDLPPRQQTMRGTVGWSYDLLTEEERALFRRLAVFSGGFALEAAEFMAAAITGPAEAGSAKHAAETLDLLTSLTDKSLILCRELPDGSTRFKLLEVVREFALEALADASESEQLLRRHAGYYLAFAERASEHLHRAESVSWLNRLEDEHDNLRAALNWSFTNDAATACRLAAALRFFWLYHTHIAEGWKWLKGAYERSFEIESGTRAKLMNSLGVGARIQGDYDSAITMHTEALAESTAAGDKREIAFSHRGLGSVAARFGDIERARRHYEKTLELSRELNDVSEIGYSLGSLGGLARLGGDSSKARSLLEESLEILREEGQTERVITNLYILGVMAYQERNPAAALKKFKEAIALAVQVQDKIHLSDLIDGVAAVLAATNAEGSAQLAGAAESLRRAIGYELAPSERLFREEYIANLKRTLNETELAKWLTLGNLAGLDETLAIVMASGDFPIVRNDCQLIEKRKNNN